MKTIMLTPDYCADFMIIDQPMRMTVSNGKIIFNESASKKLSLKLTTRFKLEHDGSDLYFLDSGTEGFEINAQMKQCFTASQGGLFQYLKQNFKLHGKSFKFTIGEMKLGKRKLIEVQSAK